MLVISISKAVDCNSQGLLKVLSHTVYLFLPLKLQRELQSTKEELSARWNDLCGTGSLLHWPKLSDPTPFLETCWTLSRLQRQG